MDDHDQQDQDDAQDIPMMDAPDLIQNPSPTQRFSIVDVLRNETGEAKDMTTAGSSSSRPAPPDPMHSNMYECDESKVLQRLQKLYPHTDIQKLPRHWNKSDRWMPMSAAHNQQSANAPSVQVLELSSDFLRVTKRKGDTKNSKDAAAVRANRPVPRSCVVFYFEMTVVNKGTGGYMGIGLSEKTVSLNRLPGWDNTSYGYHGDDGNFFASSGKGVEYGPTFTTGDVVGCGLNFIKREVFFTKNGKHLGVANTEPIDLITDLYPTVGMQTADEMVDTNFGQRPFVFDIGAEMKAAELATKKAIAAIELPPEKVLWMNSLIAKWMTHEGYSRALEALNRTTAEPPKRTGAGRSESGKEQLQHGASTLSSSTSKESQSPTAAAEVVANSVMQSIIVFGGDSSGADATTTAPASMTAANTTASSADIAKRRSVVRSVQEALEEEMVDYDRIDQRRSVMRMVKRGQLADATKYIEQHYPTLMETNRQLALLLKIQQFIEMLFIVSREMPASPAPHEQHHQHHQAAFQPNSSPLAHSPQYLHHHYHQHNHHYHAPHHRNTTMAMSHSPSSSPRPSSSGRGGKRAATSDDDHDTTFSAGAGHGATTPTASTVAGTSGGGGGGTRTTAGGTAGGHLHHNPVKRRSSDDECSSMASNDEQQQRIGSVTAATAVVSVPSQNLLPPSSNRHPQQQNGNSLPPPSSSSSSTLAAQQMMGIAASLDDGANNDNNNNFMDICEDSRDGMAPMDTSSIASGGADMLVMANGGGQHATNGNAMVGTPPTSTTIVDEPSGDEIGMFTDGVVIEFADEPHHDDAAQHGGFTNAEERSQFEHYRNLLEFGHHISQLALKIDADDGPSQGSVALRQRMNEAFSLLCYRDPTQSNHAYLFEQMQRDLVAKALNAAILESEGGESVSPLDKCFRRARYIREQALAYSASAIFADPSRLLDRDEPPLNNADDEDK